MADYVGVFIVGIETLKVEPLLRIDGEVGENGM